MFKALLSYKGSFTRPQYIIWALVQFFGTVAAMLALGVIAVIGAALAHVSSAPYMIAIVGLAMIGYQWTYWAIAAKRVRDMGYRPLVVLPAGVILILLVTWLVRSTALSQALWLLPWLLLSVWPGRSDTAPASAPFSRMVQPPPGSRAQFGLRR